MTPAGSAVERFVGPLCLIVDLEYLGQTLCGEAIKDRLTEIALCPEEERIRLAMEEMKFIVYLILALFATEIEAGRCIDQDEEEAELMNVYNNMADEYYLENMTNWLSAIC
jgi:hypothetical protein